MYDTTFINAAVLGFELPWHTAYPRNAMVKICVEETGECVAGLSQGEVRLERAGGPIPIQNREEAISEPRAELQAAPKASFRGWRWNGTKDVFPAADFNPATVIDAVLT
ncbi:hypothetical protein GLOTRDRAFT_93506 [Gloeophyllum trabeum ATCC 11539]|uniref:Uncharacterized protein n=1 Tax=Gloeophyllum trabeum (strain ATCC 11539 / FP-39264 / Madison 617) TaxID=670483 RepID=S7Q9J3_GLOTA|nr:uncharacterized protein GLOTRDRAFT_93506 [Gloeophyllum trabeum ATCC 11539]EPQ56008.1 hypothetical protein GLOTRDRAFT_93506 [Gloeophyllum trabeum ATCC 11539]